MASSTNDPIILGTAGNRNVKTYDDGGGIMFRHKFVKQIYKGGNTPTLVYEDTSAPHLVKLNTTIAWMHELFPNVYSFSAMSSEKNPIAISGKTSGTIQLAYIRDKMGEYDNGRKIRFSVFEDDSSTKYGNLYIDSTKTAGGTETCTYTISSNNDLVGKVYHITLKSQEIMTGDSTPTIYEYQTSSPFALFGIENDTLVSPNLGSVISKLTPGDGDDINYTESGSLLFRPLTKGQLEVDGDCCYCIIPGYYTSDATTYLSNYGIVTLPEDSSDLSNQGSQRYADAGFSIINDSSIPLEPGKMVLINFINNGTFRLTSNFSLSRTSVGNINSSDGISAQIKVTVDDGVSWTVSTNTSWVNLNKTSGTGTGTFTISASSNGETSARTGYVYVTSGGTTKSITVQQGGNTSSIEFENADYVVKQSSNKWTFGLDGGVNGTTTQLYSTKFTVNKAGKLTITTDAFMDQEEQPYYLYASVSTNNYDDQQNTVVFGSSNNTRTISVSVGTYYFKICIKAGAKIADDNYLGGTITYA